MAAGRAHLQVRRAGLAGSAFPWEVPRRHLRGAAGRARRVAATTTCGAAAVHRAGRRSKGSRHRQADAAPRLHRLPEVGAGVMAAMAAEGHRHRHRRAAGDLSHHRPRPAVAAATVRRRSRGTARRLGSNPQTPARAKCLKHKCGVRCL